MMDKRDTVKKINVGGVEIGGGAPVSVQTMCNTKTWDVEATVAQIKAMQVAGADIVRLAIPDMRAAQAIAEIKEQVSVPLVADIHFDHRLALAVAERGIDKIRINPGNIGGAENVKAVAEACRKRSIPIRIGVNAGSLEPRLIEKYGHPCPEAMVESAQGHVELLQRFDFDDICLSMKASSVPLTVAAYRLAAERFDYPLHLGVTETGTEWNGTIQSAVGIGTLLCEGIGNTIRVSLTADPVREVSAGIAIVKAAGLRPGGVKFVSCPTCGRTKIDLIALVHAFETRVRAEGLADLPVKVALMGCAVNGPGEAREADIGIASGVGEALLFRHGETVAKYPADRIIDVLVDELHRMAETYANPKKGE